MFAVLRAKFVSLLNATALRWLLRRTAAAAQEIARHLDADTYETFWIGITTSGAWKLCDGPARPKLVGNVP